MPDDKASAPELTLDGVSDDDPTQDDDAALGPTVTDTGKPKKAGKAEPAAPGDDDGGDDDDSDHVDIGALLRAAAGDDETDEKPPEKKPDPKPEGKKPEPSLDPIVDKPGKVQFSPEQQAHIDRMFDSRFADIQAKADAKAEARAKEMVQSLTGLTPEQLRQKRVDERAEALQVEKGLDQDTALAIARQEAENQALKAREAEARSAQTRYERQTAYVQAKSRAADPLAKLYEPDIDAFAEGGASAIDFDTAYTYVLGQKVREGDLIKRLTAAIEKRVLKQVTERGRVTPETGGGGAPTSPPANPYERRLLRAFDLDEKQFLARKAGKKR